ncbi:MAG: hypothetical protein HKN23_05210 [Verrucomicrobiales bacterium]|nr:hypothetical protein [Verrucomicrobiales bacterium]
MKFHAYPDDETLRYDVKNLIISSLVLPISPEQIRDREKLFDGGMLNLENTDRVQLAVALEKQYDIQLDDDDIRSGILNTVESIAELIQDRGKK